MAVLTFLSIRAAHVLVAAIWMGSSAFAALMLMPAVDSAGAAGGLVMQRLDRRGFHIYMTLVSLTTLASGVYLLWRFTGGFDTSVMTSREGLTFGVGGVAGVLAGAIGGAVVGRSAKKLQTILQGPVTIADDDRHRALLRELRTLRRRMTLATRAVVMLQTVALVCMSIGHYV